jgi:hypothetical protein
MSVIKSLFIPFVELYVDANFIMDLFYTSNIATVNRITLVQDSSPYKKAYVEIYEWHDTEIAYNFIMRLRDSNVETKLIYSDDDWWTVKINKKREEFYYDPNFTTENFLIDRCQEENDDSEVVYEDLKSNQKGMMLLSYIKNAVNQDQELKKKQDEEQELRDWREIEIMLETSLKCQRFELNLF